MQDPSALLPEGNDDAVAETGPGSTDNSLSLNNPYQQEYALNQSEFNTEPNSNASSLKNTLIEDLA